MATRISVAAQNAHANGVVDLLDGGSGAGYIEIRTGSQPASVATAASGTLLATLPLSNPAFGAAASGTATANPVTDDTVDASGQAGWWRAYDGSGTAVMDGTAGESGTDMILDNAALIQGGIVSISSFTYTAPAG